MPRGGRWWARACGLYTALAVALTWPLATRITTHLPIGAESRPTVPLFNFWTLRWNAERLAEGYRGYWDAPIFHATSGAFAFSEPQPLTGLLFVLLWQVSGSDVLAYNLVLLLALTLNGLAVAWMLHAFRVPPAPALLGGMLAVGLPFVANELGVLQLTMLWPLALTVGALARFAERPQLGWGLTLGAAYGATWLTCSNYGLMLTLVLPLLALPLVRRSLLGPGAMAAGLAGVGLAVALTLPVLIPQSQLTDSFTRGPQTIERLSATPEDYLRLERRTLGAAHTPWLEREAGWPRLYSGSGLLGLALLGLAVRRRWAIALSLGALVAFTFSLGLNLRLGEWQPYGQLREVVPGLDRFRSPFRFAVLVQLSLLGLAGLGLRQVWRHDRWSRVVALGLVAWSLVETVTLPARLQGLVVAFLSALLFLVTAWGLYVLLQPVNANLALLFLLLNTVGVGIQCVSLLALVTAMLLGDGSGGIQGFSAAQLEGLAYLAINTYRTGFVTAQLFFGTWLFPLGYLVYQSGFLPRPLGVLLLLDGIAVLIWFLQALLLPASHAISIPGLVVSFVAEVGLALWLLVRGVTVSARTALASP